MKCLKKWLINNKIYFETCCSLLLGIMSFCVSVNSCKLTERQIENEELLNMPLIQVKSESFDWDDKNDSEWIYITNVGTQASDYSTYKKVYLKCNYHSYNGDSNKELYLPISDMLDSSFPTNEYIGKIETYLTAKNQKYYTDLYFESGKIKNGFLFLELKQFIIVNYKDYRGIKHRDIFSVTTGFNGVKVDLTEKLEELFNTKDFYRISELSIEKIMNLVNTQGKEVE